MKTNYFVVAIVASLLVLTSFQVNGECVNTPITYYVTSGFGYISSPREPSYDDGSIPPHSYDAAGNLTVTWPHTGSGRILRYVDTFDPVILPIPITVTVAPPVFTVVPTSICNGQSYSFAISDDCGNGSSFTWTAPSGWSINGSGSSYTSSSKTVSISSPNSGSGSATISVNSNISGSSSISVWLGPPNANSSTLIFPSGQRGVNPVELATSTTYNFNCDLVQGATSYSWILPAGFSGGGPYSSVSIRTARFEGFNTLYCQASNACGSNYTSSLGINLTVGGGGGGGGGPQPRIAQSLNEAEVVSDYSNQVFPSPADKLINIVTNVPSRITLKSSDGSVIHDLRASEKVILSTENIPAGIYFVGISTESGNQFVKVLVRH